MLYATCVYTLFATVKLSIKFFNVLSTFNWKRIRGVIRWNIVVLLGSIWASRMWAIKFLKWLMNDLSATKLAQSNPWLKNYKFPQIGIKADAYYCKICNAKVPFWDCLISLKSDRWKSSVFLQRSTNLSTLVQSDLI